MGSGTEAPLKYTKESFLGVYDAWAKYAAAKLSEAAVFLEQYADKLPPSVKSKFPAKYTSPKSTETATGANAPS